MNVDVDGTSHTVLVSERQRNPVTSALVHVDFQAVSLTETLRVKSACNSQAKRRQ